MVCPTCQHDAPYSQLQWDKRKRELERDPRIGVFPCPDCGGTDYMLSRINIDVPPPAVYDGMLARKPPTGTAEAMVAALKRMPSGGNRVQMYKEIGSPPRSLWARLLDWWNSRRSPWIN